MKLAIGDQDGEYGTVEEGPDGELIVEDNEDGDVWGVLDELRQWNIGRAAPPSQYRGEQVMAQNDNGALYQRNSADITSGVAPLELSEIHDPVLRADLERIEERIYSYGNDVLDGWLGMAMSLNSRRVCTESLPVL